MVEGKAAPRTSSKKQKILLLYASAGAGHRSACAAIMQSLRDLGSDADLKVIDILDFMPRVFSRIYSRGYVIIASRYPMLWYLIYESGSDLSTFKPSGFWHRVFWGNMLSHLFEMLRNERPDQIVSSHFLSSWAAGYYKRKYDGDCIVSTVVTDYGVHPAWISSDQDIVFVPTEQVRVELSAFTSYLGTSRIITAGIPIHPSFGRKKDARALKLKYNLDPEKPTILILGGMFGSRNVREILLSLTESRANAQLLLVAGRHYPVSERIKEHFVERGMKYQIFGYIDFMDELMAVSDLAITKAGALTTSECLASGLPMVIFRPYPGQEERNCDYFLEQGVAVRVDQISGVSYKVDGILLEAERLERMKARALEVARPDSSEEIARFLLESRR